KRAVHEVRPRRIVLASLKPEQGSGKDVKVRMSPQVKMLFLDFCDKHEYPIQNGLHMQIVQDSKLS
ncbi:hypothetical protein CO051_01030, partial [Candidatus Roizmanbacteria bacterium CG_4_9_14_0_2_um_filter_39_13]